MDETRKGKFKVGRETEDLRFHNKFKALYRWVKAVSRQRPPAKWWPILKAKLVGHYRYYGVSGNYPLIARYYYLTVWALHKWLNRRSQKPSYNWEEFLRYLKHYPLPRPRYIP